MDRTDDLNPISRAIKAAGGKQADLAARIGVTQQAVSLMARTGKVSPQAAVKVALLLGERPERLWPEMFSLSAGDAA